jgi:hypothetical protein
MAPLTTTHTTRTLTHVLPPHLKAHPASFTGFTRDFERVDFLCKLIGNSDSVGPGCMRAGFTWMDRSLESCGSERIGREEEGMSSGRVAVGRYAGILKRTERAR